MRPYAVYPYLHGKWALWQRSDGGRISYVGRFDSQAEAIDRVHGARRQAKPEPSVEMVDTMLAQIRRDRTSPYATTYWSDRGDHLDAAESWLLSLRDWLEGRK